jgi:clathrin heavy chain
MLLKDMMSKGPQNMRCASEVAKKYNEELGPGELVQVFEQNRATEGLYYYIGAIVNMSGRSVCPLQVHPGVVYGLRCGRS